MMATYVYTGKTLPRSKASRPSQDRVLAFIEVRLRAGLPPTCEEIRRHMGWMHRRSVHDAIRTINARGCLPEGFEPDMDIQRERKRPGVSRRVLTMNGWEDA